jgi:hypothetical protein
MNSTFLIIGTLVLNISEVFINPVSWINPFYPSRKSAKRSDQCFHIYLQLARVYKAHSIPHFGWSSQGTQPNPSCGRHAEAQQLPDVLHPDPRHPVRRLLSLCGPWCLHRRIFKIHTVHSQDILSDHIKGIVWQF